MSSSSSIVKQQSRRRMHPNSHRSRNSNAYFDRDEYYRPSLINHSNTYWNDDYNYYPSSRKDRSMGTAKRSEPNYQSKSNPLPPARRHRLSQSIDPREQATHGTSQVAAPVSDSTKASRSSSSSSANSHRKETATKNHLAATAAGMAARQQTQSNFNTVQTLMNSLILQQQHQQPPSSSTTQLTNALVATFVQQRLKEAALQIQAALPTFLAAQALAYQQQINAQPVPIPPHIAHPGTKFNNRPLVKFPIVRPSVVPPPMLNPLVRPVHPRLITPNPSTTTSLPTYQQVHEIERGVSLEEAIQLKNAIDIAEPSTTKVDT